MKCKICSCKKSGKRGFTFVEMSIVLVIIGFLISGIMVGKSLLRSSEVRAVVAESAKYTQALGTFRDKFQALPGDFAGATAVFSGTANGNGDGMIVLNTANAGVGTELNEQFLAWQHLAKAEMIKGSFTGAAGGAGARDRVVGSNIPASELTAAGWGIISVTLTDISAAYSEIPYTAPDIAPNHVLWLGGGSITGTADSQKPVLTPAEALDIDKKIDDGIATTGKIISQTSTSCYTGTAYNATSSDISCALVFKTGF